MKSTIRIFLLFAVIAGLVTCDALDVDFDTTFRADMNAVVDDPGKSALATYYFTADKTIDPNSDEEVKKYADKIKNYKVNSVELVVTAVSTNGVVLTGSTVEVSKSGLSAEWSIPDNFAVEVGNSHSFTNAENQWDTVRDILLNHPDLEVSVEGYSSVNNITMVLTLMVDVTITASPL